MHASKQLAAETFTIEIDGMPARVADLLPAFDEHDRLGVVIGRPHGLVGASLLWLAAVFAFYEVQRKKSDDFWIYPDFFVFHVGRPFGHHGSLDAWPPHKEVVVAPDATTILQAINDRAVTWLAVEEDAISGDELEPEARASADARLRGALTYSVSGRVRDPDVWIGGDSVTESFVRAALDPQSLMRRLGPGPEADTVRAHLAEVPQTLRDELASQRGLLQRDGQTVESYRRIPVEAALRSLVPHGAAD